jgi:hypothetical protein
MCCGEIFLVVNQHYMQIVFRLLLLLITVGHPGRAESTNQLMHVHAIKKSNGIICIYALFINFCQQFVPY